MSTVSGLRYAYLAYFSQPKRERLLYRQLRKWQPKRMVEIGIGTMERSINLLGVAQRYANQQTIAYTGFDWFEERSRDQSPLPLIHAHRQLQIPGIRPRLVPGPPSMTLPQLANSLQQTDLILISHALDDAELEPTWFYLPRMCHGQTLLLRETGTGPEPRFEEIPLLELQRRAEQRPLRRAA